MSDSEIEVIWRLARWKINRFERNTSRRSDSFRVGLWNWYLYVEHGSNPSTRSSYYSDSPPKPNFYYNVKLFMERCLSSEECQPEAKFVLRISNSGPGQQPRVSSVQESLFKTGGSFVWTTQSDLFGNLIINAEFLDLKISSAKVDEAPSVLLPADWIDSQKKKSSNVRLSRMLQENIHTDLTIKTRDGELNAHKAVLVASSPVFRSMFQHDLREKESSILEIEDMSQEPCSVLLNYLYGIIEGEDLWKHRQVLLSAADKYDIVDLKECCEESFLEDLATDNVLDRLRDSQLYQLHRLKKRCLSFLFNFGKINDIKDDVSSFLCQSEQALVAEMFQEMLIAWSEAYTFT